jgi:hypothetical protein
MTQSVENIWTPRFLLLVGLVLAGQIILGIIAYTIFGHLYTSAELALAAFLLLFGVGLLGLLVAPAPRKIVLGAGFFVLIALLLLIVSSGFQKEVSTGQPASMLQQVLSYVALVLGLLAFLGRIATRKAAVVEEAAEGWTEDMISLPTSWFIRLSHLVLASIAGLELLLQLAFGNRLLLVPFTNRLYDGFTLNNVAVLLLGALLVFSLLRFKSPSTSFDGWMLLILALACFLLQYTFGPRELTGIDPRMSQSQAVGLNLMLSIVPLALAIGALFSAWGRLFAPLWLAFQLLILQQFLREPLTPTRTGGAFPPTQNGQLILYVLVIALIMLALRLVLYWDRRQLNVIDVIAVALITLVLGLTMWSLGRNYAQQAQSFLNTQQGINLLSLFYSFFILAYLIGIAALLAIVLICIHLLFRRRYPWLSRVESLVGSLLVLGITIGTLLLLNAIGNQSSYLAMVTLNPQLLNANLPGLSISNQYVLDGLIALLLLLYASALARQGWKRQFAHTERVLILLSGYSCWLILASTGRRPVLPLVVATIQQIGVRSLPVFTVERMVTTSVLLAALVSLLWLTRSRNRTDRIVLLALFGIAVLCALVHYFFPVPVLLLVPLLLLTPGTLIAARIEHIELPLPGRQATLQVD